MGRMFVLAGAIWKGKSEINEMMSLGVKKYFQTTVKNDFFLVKSFSCSNRVLVFLKIVYPVYFVQLYI
jgi:hypothetical protein